MNLRGLILILILLWVPAILAQDVRVKILPQRVDAVIDHKGAYPKLADAYPKLSAWISLHGYTPDGNSLAVYFDDAVMVQESRRRSQARIPVNVYGKVLPKLPGGKAKARLERTPPTLVITTLHQGPYSQILTAYTRLRDRLASLGLEATGPMQESYFNTPDVTPAADLRTEVRLEVTPKGTVDIGVYADWGGYPRGVRAASLCFTDAGLRVRPVVASEINDGSFRKNVRALYFPGGWAEHYVRDIDKKGAKHIQKFVSEGGGYIGICAGSFFAAREIVWSGAKVSYDLDLFPGVPEGPIASLAPWPGYVTTSLILDQNHPITKDGPKKRTALYYGGPALNSRPGKDVSVLARYATGDPAMVACTHRKGRVFLSSAHVEFDLTSDRDGTTWPEDEKGIRDPEPDWDLLQSAARWVLKKK